MVFNIQYKNIKIMSPPETGSILLNNIIKLLFQNINISNEKIYDLQKYLENDNLIIIQLRDPYDSITSIMSTKNINIKNSINNYKEYGVHLINNDYKLLLEKNNVIFFVYEKFINNIDYIFQILENRLKIKIDDELKMNIYDKVKNSFYYHKSKEILSSEDYKYLKTNLEKENILITELIKKVNKYNKLFYKKTVIHILNGKNTNNKAIFSFTGIGDLIEGSYVLHNLSKQMNFNLVIDFSYYNLKKFMDYKNNLYSEYLKTINPEYVPHIFNSKKLINYIKDNNNDIILLTTNSKKCKDNLDTNSKEFLKNNFKPKKEIENIINKKIAGKDFNIIHFRLYDELSKKEIHYLNDLNKYENIFKKFYEKNDLFLTNNIFFKNYILSKYNCNHLNINIKHSGLIEKDDSDKIIFENLIEFFIQMRSKKIKTYSDYNWISGFVFWNSFIYNIPLENIKLANIENKIKLKKYFFIENNSYINNKIKKNLKKVKFCNYDIKKNLTNFDLFFCKIDLDFKNIITKYSKVYELVFIVNELPLIKYLMLKYYNKYNIKKDNFITIKKRSDFNIFMNDYFTEKILKENLFKDYHNIHYETVNVASKVDFKFFMNLLKEDEFKYLKLMKKFKNKLKKLNIVTSNFIKNNTIKSL